MTTDAGTPRQTPLLDLLRGVPKDGRAIYEHGPTHSQSIPYGRMCHEAADVLAAAEAERDALRARVAGLEDRALELSVCLRNLVFMAETSGGTAGRDEALCTVIAQARALLAPSSEETK